MIEQFNGIQYTGHNGKEIEKWSDGIAVESPVIEPSDNNPTGAYMQIKDDIGTYNPYSFAIANVDDWIIKSGNTYIVLSPEEFDFYLSERQ